MVENVIEFGKKCWRVVGSGLRPLCAVRGSVMMEFIVVMPIYLVLFGGTCAIGDILVHSGRLLSADRFSAFFADEEDKPRELIEYWVSSMFRQPGDRSDWTTWKRERAANGNDLNRITVDSDFHYADSTAAWSVCAAAKTTDDFYIGAGGGIAQIVAGKYWVEHRTGSGNNRDFWADFARNGYRTLYSRPGADMFSGKYSRSYYILKRKKYYDASGRLKQTWREAPESSLMKRGGSGWTTEKGNSAWEDEVYGEGWFDASSIGDGVSTKGRIPHCPEAGARACKYSRYPQFVNWSN